MKYGGTMFFHIPEPLDTGEIGAHAAMLDLQQRTVKVLAMHEIDVVIAGRTSAGLPFEANEDWWRTSCEAQREEHHHA